jgi:hypothetical protein
MSLSEGRRSRFSEATDLARKTAEMASHDIGIRETGRNSGKRIKQYLATVGLKPGQPYCIAAVCTWIKEAAAAGGVKQELLFSPSCLRFLDYAVKTHHAFLPSELTPGMLPCVFIIDHGKGKGHAGLVIGIDEEGKALDTIEANTNPLGSREGDGVYARTRQLSEVVALVRIA